jgi:hypothetical protein
MTIRMVRILTVRHGIRSSGSTILLIGRINAVVRWRVSGAGFEYDALEVFSLLRRCAAALFKAEFQEKQLIQFLSGTCSAQRNACRALRGESYTGWQDRILSDWVSRL